MNDVVGRIEQLTVNTKGYGITKSQPMLGTIVFNCNQAVPVIKINTDGTIEWNGKVVDGDEVFKNSMMDLNVQLHATSGHSYYSQKVKEYEEKIDILKHNHQNDTVANTMLSEALKDLEVKNNKLKEALNWYRDEAVAIANNINFKNGMALEASIAVLSLDNGKRADDALK